MTVAQTRFGPHNSKLPLRSRATGAVTEPSGSLGTIDLTSQASSIASPRAEQGGVSIVAQLYALAAELAKPVALGDLSLTDAHAEMLLSTARSERLGELGQYTCPNVFRLQQHILGLHLERLETQRAGVEGRIKRRLKPLIALRKPSNVLLAEAHDVNGAAGFPLLEPEVTDIAVTEMYWSLPQHGGRRHAR